MKEEMKMDKRAKYMLAATAFFLLMLIIKSLWIDPVRNLEGNEEKFMKYAYGAAPSVSQGLLDKTGLLTYRVIKVLKEEKEGITMITYQNASTEELVNEKLDGVYRAKVRAYILHIIPIKDIQVKGEE
jgi:hypothetical protein